MKRSIGFWLTLLVAQIIGAQAAFAVNKVPLKPDGANAAPCTVFGSPNNGMSCGKTTAPATTLDVAGTVTATGFAGPLAGATFGIVTSTQAVGGAGAAVTAVCPGSKTAIGGGCSCSGIVGATSIINRPDLSGSAPTAAQLANGWLCQVPGGTGGACIAYAVCANMSQ